MKGEEVALRRTASEKIQETAKTMRAPRSGATGPELALSTLTQGLSAPQARAWLQEADENDMLDPFLELLAVWLCAHRGDDAKLLLVLEVPRDRVLPPGTLMELVREARQIALGPPPDLSAMAAAAPE